MSEELVHIVMPAYNAEATLAKSVDAIINQTHKNWQLYIVNDGSEDLTLDIADKYGDDNDNILVINQVNNGVSAARNAALEYIPDDAIIAYCDADDVWLSEHLKTSLTVLESGADVTYCNPFIVNEKGNQMYPSFPLYINFNGNNLRKSNFIYISSVVHKGKLGLFDSNVDSLEDYDMWIRAFLNKKRFIQKPNSTVTYLVKEDGMAPKGSMMLEKVKTKYKSFFEEIPETKLIKLHLGCGENYLDGYVNVDMVAKKVDERYDVSILPYPDNTVDEIFASHVIEHFTFQKGFKVMHEWYRALKPGGILRLETPDFLESCKAFVRGDEQYRIKLYGHFFAYPEESLYNAHFFLFTETQLRWQLEQVGFKSIVRKEPVSGYYKAGNPAELFLYVEATK